MNVVILCLGDKWQDWENMGFANRSANMAKELSNHPSIDNLVIVNNPTSYAQALRRYCKGILPSRNTRWRSIYGFFVDEVKPKTTVVEQIRLFPRESSRATIFKLNGLFYDGELVWLINKMIREKSQSPLLLWINNPALAKFIGSLDEDLVIYDARDDWFFHPRFRSIRNEITKGYYKIKEKADVVLAVSENLVKKLKGGHAEVFHVPNGIDDQIFHHSDYEIPDDLAALPRPMIGYIGKMQRRFDVGFMVKVAGLMPEASFVLVGPVFEPDHFEPLKKMKNVHFLGWKHQSLMPGYISHFDVCMMPHVDDPLTSAMNPLKLYEYLAIGKPTVCTGVQGLEQFKGLVEVAYSPQSFVDRVRVMLSESADKKLNREEFAKGQSWRHRIDHIMEILERKLVEKSKKQG